MNEEQFMKKYPKEEITIPIYFTNQNGKVVIDYEGMQSEFNELLRDILNDVNPELLE